MGSIGGPIAIFIVGSLSMELRVDRALGLSRKGKRVVISMLELIRMILNMVMVSLRGRQGVDIRANILMIRKKAMGKCIGMMVVFIEVFGKREFKMVLEL